MLEKVKVFNFFDSFSKDTLRGQQVVISPGFSTVGPVQREELRIFRTVSQTFFHPLAQFATYAQVRLIY